MSSALLGDALRRLLAVVDLAARLAAFALGGPRRGAFTRFCASLARASGESGRRFFATFAGLAAPPPELAAGRPTAGETSATSTLSPNRSRGNNCGLIWLRGLDDLNRRSSQRDSITGHGGFPSLVDWDHGKRLAPLRPVRRKPALGRRVAEASSPVNSREVAIRENQARRTIRTPTGAAQIFPISAATQTSGSSNVEIKNHGERLARHRRRTVARRRTVQIARPAASPIGLSDTTRPRAVPLPDARRTRRRSTGASLRRRLRPPLWRRHRGIV